MNTLELMNQYCEESGELYVTRRARREILEYEQKIGKSFLEMEEWEIRDMFAAFQDQKKNTVSHIIAKSMINDYISFYTRFFDWCIEKGYITGTNIFLLKSLSSKEIHKMLSELYKDEIPVLLHEKDFEAICKCCDKFFENGFYVEIILRMLYEGVIYRIDEAKDIKVEDVCLEEDSPRIHVKNRDVIISTRLKQLLKNVSEDSFVLTNNTIEVVRIDNSYLYFVCKKGNHANTISSVMRRKFADLSNETGSSITPDYIYYSGFYNFLLKKTNYDEEKVYDMLYDGHYAINSVVKELTQMAGEFGIKKEGKHIRTTVSKYRMEYK